MTPLEKREMWITPMQEFYAAFRHRLQQAGWDTAWSDKLFEQFEDDIATPPAVTLQGPSTLHAWGCPW